MSGPTCGLARGARLEGLHKRTGSTEILKGLDLEFLAGEFTVLLGPSGCGKSTTLRIIAGLERQSEGRVFIGDRDVSDLEPRERDVAMVFQSYALYPTMTVAQNIGFGLRARGAPRREAAERVRETAALLGLEALLKRMPSELSGGQQQRVAIGRAIVRRPALFLFDEPLSNLDARLRVRMRGELMLLHRAIGATTILVTHDQEEALSMADRIIVMDGGRVAQVGAPSEVFRKPATAMVADFIGSPAMNLMKAFAAPDRIETPLGAVALRAPGAGSVQAGFRPDDVLAGEEHPATGPCLRYCGTIELTELLGPRAILTLRTGDTLTRVVVPEGRLAALARGGRLEVAVPYSKLHFFDGVAATRIEPTFADRQS
ncbi:ABC transporter ATP-binding protein [Rubrimonas sp.]|uniref:ABC transporter ATP-binding protein n=1 Tax=Rubrimonas sp. TaxID=2036015 RepID=UPI002FDDB5DB